MNLTQLHDYFKDSSGVVTDSRELTQDSFFISLKGENFDGNQFAKMALESGLWCLLWCLGPREPVHRLAQGRISRNLIENMPARAARRNF